MTNIVFMESNWSVTHLLMNVLQVFIIPYEAAYLPVHLLLFNFLMLKLTKMNTQKCGNFEKIMRVTSSHDQSPGIRACLNNVNVSQ